ncbi:hypothetical protein [Nonomuraea africana]|uniref:hypothetical protein n=1 Tax=Nonomuraea africana TaxID=46171 RepID=UPI0033E76FFE
MTDDPERGERELDAYCLATYGLPYRIVRTVQVLVAGPVERVAGTLGGYVEAGAEHLVCRVPAVSAGRGDLGAQHDQLELIVAARRLMSAKIGA